MLGEVTDMDSKGFKMTMEQDFEGRRSITFALEHANNKQLFLVGTACLQMKGHKGGKSVYQVDFVKVQKAAQ